MTKRLPISQAAGPLEEYSARFERHFRAGSQCEGLCRCVGGSLAARRAQQAFNSPCRHRSVKQPWDTVSAAHR